MRFYDCFYDFRVDLLIFFNVLYPIEIVCVTSPEMSAAEIWS